MGILVFGNGYAYDASINILAQVDRSIFGIDHLYHRSPVDPEGLLSTIPAIAHTMIGFLCCKYISIAGQNVHSKIKFLKISGKFSGMKTHKATGGSAGNTVLALANLGAHPGFIGKIGNDDFGQYFKKNGLKQGIDMKLLAGDLPTGVASTFISPDGERTFGTYLGAAATMKAENLTLDMFKGYAYLYIEGYLVQDHELILRAMQLGKEAGLQICLDMASYNIVEGDLEFFDILITKYVDIVFANEEEAKAYTGKDAWGAINEIASKCSVVIVKLGAQGSCIKKGTECIKLEVPPVKKVVDTTGAGDYYAAGFLYGLTCGYSLEKCSIIGSILASNVIQVVGTTLSKKKWDEIKLNIEALLQA
jgi:sugar/nucleoside kinase (ribokinase family)